MGDRPQGVAKRTSLARRAPHAWAVLLAFLALIAVATVPGSILTSVTYQTAPPPLPPAAAADRDGTLDVVTRDAHGAAVGGAFVQVLVQVEGRVFRAATARTGDDGRAHLEGLPRGEAWLVADRDGFARGSSHVLIFGPGTGGSRAATLVLGPEHTFTADVTAEGGDAIEGATIEVAGADPLPVGARTDAQGHARVGRLGAPPWVVTVSAPGYDETTLRDVHDGDALHVALKRLGSIVVHVEDPGGKPVQDAVVRIAGASLWPAREGKTGPHGGVKLAGLYAGSYALRAVHGTQASPIELAFPLGAGENKELTLRLVPGRMVQVLVTDSDADDAAPVRDARVVLAEGGVSPFPMEATTDRRGRALLGPIAGGDATVSARADGYVGRAPVQVPEPLQGPVRVVLSRAATLTGRVVDARGFPVGGATLEIVGTDFAGGPIDDDPRRASFRESEFRSALGGPAPLVPAGELGVMPGPVPPIPAPGQSVGLGGSPWAAAGPSPWGAAAGANGSLPTIPPPEPWVTRQDGTFRASPVTPGRVRAVVRHPEYVETYSDMVTLAPGGEADVTIVLRRGGDLQGRVVDASGTPVSGARLDLLAVHGTLERSTRTASDGTFAFAAVPQDLALDVYADEDALHPATRVSVSVKEGERREITITLPAPREATAVRVRDDRGYPVEKAQVSATSLDPSAPVRLTAFTDADGDATLAGVRGLHLRLEVTAPSFAPHDVTLAAAPDRLDVALAAGAAVTGEVRAARGGDPVSDADVVFYTDVGVRHARTDDQGAFTLADLAPGSVRVRVTAAGYAPAERRATLRGGEARPAALAPFDLSAEGVVEGVVRDGHGDPVAGARVAQGRVPVYLAAGTAPPGVAVTDAEGHFHLGGLAEGTVSLEAYAPDVGRGRVEGVRVTAGRTTDDVRITLESEGAPERVPMAAGSVAVTLGETGDPREVVIVLVAEGSEAERAGLLPGDVVLSVDGTAVHTIEQARAKMSGPLEADVVLQIRRGGRTLAVRVGREEVRR